MSASRARGHENLLSGGALRKSTDGGANWTTQTPGTSAMLFKLFFLNPSQGYVVGDLGTLLKTTDGGATWLPQNSGTTQLLQTSSSSRRPRATSREGRTPSSP